MLREKRRHANSKPNRKLDRKSSRGMIYENEELRLRTININAEVERGQSDIKKLRRENDHLRREIWSLRDEYDRLDKLLRSTQGLASDIGERPHLDRTIGYAREDGRGGGGGGGGEDDDDDDDDGEVEEDDDEEELICEQCQQFEESCECSPLRARDLRNISAAATFRPRPPPRHDKPNFDDLSVVSEETVHSAETVITDPDSQRLSLNAPPLGAFEYPSNVPSLAHFENLCYEKIGPNLTSSGELVFEGPHVSGEKVDADLLPSPPPPPQLTPLVVPEAFQDVGIGPPDICMYTTGQSAPLRMRPRGNSTSNGGGAVSRFSTGGNLEDLLHDLDNLSVDHSLMSSGDKKQRKQRSEMNLVLTIDGDTTTITPVTPAAIPITVDSPATPAGPTPPPPIGWKPELPPKPDKPVKSKFPWLVRLPGTAEKQSPQDPQSAASLPPSQSAQQIRRKSIPVNIDQSQNQQPQHSNKAATATISKRRFSLRRNSDSAQQNAARTSGQPQQQQQQQQIGGGASSSAERTTTHSVSSSPESSASHQSQRSQQQRPQPRRISTGSHDNATGSIPWCACWGNGCI